MNFEPKMGPIEDIEQARVGAHAEKPFRDFARTEGIEPEEKVILDEMAEKRGEKAIETYRSEVGDNKAPTGSFEKKNNPQEIVEKAFDLIKSNPNINFAVHGVGNILGKPNGDPKGGGGYVFDKNTQRMVFSGTFDFLDSVAADRNVALFTPIWGIYQGYNDAIYITVKNKIIALRGEGNESYFAEDRTGAHIAFVISYIKNKLDNLGNKQIQEKLTAGDHDFAYALMTKCAEEFIPDYFKTIKDLETAYNKKLAR